MKMTTVDEETEPPVQKITSNLAANTGHLKGTTIEQTNSASLADSNLVAAIETYRSPAYFTPHEEVRVFDSHQAKSAAMKIENNNHSLHNGSQTERGIINIEMQQENPSIGSIRNYSKSSSKLKSIQPLVVNKADNNFMQT